MNKNSVTTFALSLTLFVVLSLIGAQPVHAALTINPPGSWKVTSAGASGVVGDIVTVEFAITYVTDSYAGTDFYIKTDGEAREKLSFVGVVPAAASVSAEQIDWPKTEFEAGVTNKYKVQVRIDRGAVGDEIEGFYISTYTGKSIMFGVADDIKVKVIAKSSSKPAATATTAATKTTPRPTPAPTKAHVTSLAKPTVIPTPVAIASITPTPTPINPIDPDGDGLPNDQEAMWGSNPYVFDTDGDGMPDGDEIRNGTNPAGDTPEVNSPTLTPIATIQPQSSSLPPQQSFFSRTVAGISARFRAIGNWFAELF